MWWVGHIEGALGREHVEVGRLECIDVRGGRVGALGTLGRAASACARWRVVALAGVRYRVGTCCYATSSSWH